MQRQTILVSAFLLLVPAELASAFSPKVEAAFKGQILISNGPLESKGDDKATIAAIKQAAIKQIVCAPDGDDVDTAQFYLTAFLTAPAGASGRLNFVEPAAPTAPLHSYSQAIDGNDPATKVLELEISVTADDLVGPNWQITYDQGAGKPALASGSVAATCKAPTPSSNKPAKKKKKPMKLKVKKPGKP